MRFIAELIGLGWLLDWFAAWWAILMAYGTAGLIVAGLIALAIIAPWFNLKQRIAILAAAGIVITHTIAFTVGIKKGADRVQTQWDRSLDREEKQGENARVDAEHSVAAEPDSVLSDDPWNRDRWPK